MDYGELINKIKKQCEIDIGETDGTQTGLEQEIIEHALSKISLGEIYSKTKEQIKNLKEIFSPYSSSPAVQIFLSNISLILKLKEPKNEKIYKLFTVESGEVDTDFISSVEKFRGLCSRNKKIAALWLNCIQEGEKKEESFDQYMKKLTIYQNIKPYLDANQDLEFETGIRKKLPLVDYTRLELNFLESDAYKNASTYQKNRKLQYILEELQERLNNRIQQQDQSLLESSDLGKLQELLNEEIKKRDTSWYEDLRALTFPLAMFSSCVTSAYFPNISTGVTNFITFVPILGPAAAFLFTLFAIYENRFIDRGNQNIQLYLLILANVYTAFVLTTLTLANTIMPALSTILPLTGFFTGIAGLPLVGILFISFMARGAYRTVESKELYMPNINELVEKAKLEEVDVVQLKTNLQSMLKRMYSVRNPLELRSIHNQLNGHIKTLSKKKPMTKEIQQAILELTNTKRALGNHKRRNLLILSIHILGIAIALTATFFAPPIAIPMTIAAMYIQGIGVGTIAAVFGIDKALSNFRWWHSVFFKQEKTLDDIKQSHTIDVQRNCDGFVNIPPLINVTGRRNSWSARTTLAAKVAKAEETAKIAEATAKAGEEKPPRGNIAKRRHSSP